MELMDAIKGRRSIRKFTGEPVAREAVIEHLLEAATWAPSGQNLATVVLRGAHAKREIFSSVAFSETWDNGVLSSQRA